MSNVLLLIFPTVGVLVWWLYLCQTLTRAGVRRPVLISTAMVLIALMAVSALVLSALLLSGDATIEVLEPAGCVVDLVRCGAVGA